MATKRKRWSAEDLASRVVITDGCNPELVSDARFDGILGIPIIEKPDEFVIPSGIVPFSKMHRVEPRKFAVCEYEMDREFASILRTPEEYVQELRHYQAFITPDASLYWDMPLAAQIVNKYRNHVVGHYMQARGIYTIPNVRWGDERTYSTDVLPEPLAFLGVERNSIVSIGSYGILKSKLEKKHFQAGLEAMMKYLEPRIVLVYGTMPEEIFKWYWPYADFIRYPDWTSYVRRGEEQAQPEPDLQG